MIIYCNNVRKKLTNRIKPKKRCIFVARNKQQKQEKIKGPC